MVNVLIISTTLASGGMQRQLSTFLQYYDRNKFCVTVALLENKIEYEVPKDVQIIDLKRKRKRQFSFYFRLISLLSRRRYAVINSKISGLNELVMLFCGLLRK